MLKLTGYPDRYSAGPGERVEFKISLEEGDSFEARLVRVIHGDANPQGPGLKFRHVPSGADGRHPGFPQPIDAGSFMSVADFPALDKPFTFYVMIWPTLIRRDDQTILAQWDTASNTGPHIGLKAGGFVAITLGGAGAVAEAVAPKAMVQRQWYALAVVVDPQKGIVRINQSPIVPYAMSDDRVSAEFSLTPAAPVQGLTMAGTVLIDGAVGRHFDGKLDSPILVAGTHPAFLQDRLAARPHDVNVGRLVIAHWDFSQKIETAVAVDIGPYGRHGLLHNLPTRGMKGWNWTGEEHAWTRKREHYGAIHFHSNDLYDASWKTSVAVTLPEDLPSGPYALHVRCGESDVDATREDYISFFVTPPRDPAKRGKRPKLLFLAPTSSYIAYANHAEHITARGVEILMNRMVHFGHSDLWMYDHPELGGSLYDTHADGSGVAYSSRLRPVLMKAWIDRGGRLMYMGGNGWYWRVAFSDAWPGAMELRRAEDGIRPWIAEPGEYYHSFNGEYGGLWRRIGRAPNVMAGVGFIAQGVDFSSYCRRAPDAGNPRARFIFEGVPDEIIGDFGLVGRGAAGIELDCITTDLGSPTNMLKLATSEGHSGLMLLVNEEFGPAPPNLGGDQNDRVRADLAFGETPAGGALFATSSIAWCGALSHNNYDNNVSRITENVLRRFLDPAPFPTSPQPPGAVK